MKKIFIVAPPYSEKSAGIVALHELCDSLNGKGYDAYIILLIIDGSNSKLILEDNPKFFNHSLQRKSIRKLDIKNIIELNNEIVIYPEIISGNPLGFKYVARYFLNSEGTISGNRTNQKNSDYIISWDERFHPKANFILNKYPHSNLIKNGNLKNEKRTLDLTFIGKGSKFQNCFKIKDTLLLTTNYPETKEDYAYLLQNTRYIYMWDNVTSVQQDAILSGATIVLLCDLPISRYELKKMNVLPFLRGEIINGNEANIVFDPDHETKREEYISNIAEVNKSWPKNSNEMMKDLYKFFCLQ